MEIIWKAAAERFLTVKSGNIKARASTEQLLRNLEIFFSSTVINKILKNSTVEKVIEKNNTVYKIIHNILKNY
jgi:hypothetical protein